MLIVLLSILMQIVSIAPCPNPVQGVPYFSPYLVCLFSFQNGREIFLFPYLSLFRGIGPLCVYRDCHLLYVVCFVRDGLEFDYVFFLGSFACAYFDDDLLVFGNVIFLYLDSYNKLIFIHFKSIFINKINYSLCVLMKFNMAADSEIFLLLPSFFVPISITVTRFRPLSIPFLIFIFMLAHYEIENK